MEILAIGKAITDTGSTVALIGVLAVLAIPPLRKKIFGGLNGSAENIQSTLKTIEENHLHTLEDKLDRLMEAEKEGNLISKEILFVLKNKK